MTQNPGWSNWYLSSTVPQSAPSGTYTLTVSCSYSGATSSRSSNFTVQSTATQPSGGVTVSRVWTNDGGSDWSTTKTTFNPGDPVRYIGAVTNSTGAAATIAVTYDVRGAGGQIAFWSGSPQTGSGEVLRGLLRTIPDTAVGGTYTFTMSVTYSGQTSSKSTTFTVNAVNAVNPYGGEVTTPTGCNPLTGCVPRENGSNEKGTAISAVKGTCGTGAGNWIVTYPVSGLWQGAHRTRLRFYDTLPWWRFPSNAALIAPITGTTITGSEVQLCLGSKYLLETEAKASWIWIKP